MYIWIIMDDSNYSYKFTSFLMNIFFFASQKSGVTHAVSCNFAEKEIDSYNFFTLEKKNG